MPLRSSCPYTRIMDTTRGLGARWILLTTRFQGQQPGTDRRVEADPGHQVLDTPLGERGANLPERVSLRARLHARVEGRE